MGISQGVEPDRSNCLNGFAALVQVRNKRKAPQPILRSLSHFQARSHLLQHPLPRSGLSFKFLFAAFQNFVAETTRNLAVCEEFHCERPLTLRH